MRKIEYGKFSPQIPEIINNPGLHIENLFGQFNLYHIYLRMDKPHLFMYNHIIRII